MAIRKIARMGHPVLRQKARELTVTEILSPEMTSLLQDMIDTMNDYGGIGLAAPQIYEPIAVAIVDYQEDHPRYAEQTQKQDKAAENSSLPFTIVFNPKVTVLDATEQSYWEGCLSVPELRGWVTRPKKIQIDYLDIKARPKTVIAEGFLATVFQHELDHLDGVLYIDRVKNEVGQTKLAFEEEYSRYWAKGSEEDENDEVDVDQLSEEDDLE